jgi:hypothetical protein
MNKQIETLPPGQHPHDPAKKDQDEVAFSLNQVQTCLTWIAEHRAGFEKARSVDPETAESELSNLRVCTRDAMVHLQRLSELLLAGHAIDPKKRLPASLEKGWFSSCVERMLDAEKEEEQSSER